MLDFLATATIVDVAESKVARKGGLRKQRNPVGLAIRVFRDGSIYPSEALVHKFSLEYGPKSANTGNGFDVVDTALYPMFLTDKRILIVSPVAKIAPKVDLFGSTTYDDKGNPKVSVLEQGSKTYGKEELLPAIKEIYNLETSEALPFIDLEFIANPATGEPWGLPASKEVTFLPKKVSRGKAKDQISTIRREKPQFWALIPSSIVSEADPAQQPNATATELPAQEEVSVTQSTAETVGA